ncbi:uncharacterized protein PSANT_07091 [Moesziomyces antarcticus]|uniref:Uncharacterized protein n=1 Tax=Pseudozyma antarctica TaxID=84753 RepID=A0A5C3FYI2_PSEA2|nr:uncharacterized protein PSANT_07091 [Moesziomyces antarcticus]
MRTISRVRASWNLPLKSELRLDAPQGDETLAGKAKSISSGRERTCKRARCKERCDSIMGHRMCSRCGCSPTNPRETMHEMLKRRPDAEPVQIMPIPDAASLSLDEAITHPFWSTNEIEDQCSHQEEESIVQVGPGSSSRDFSQSVDRSKFARPRGGQRISRANGRGKDPRR